MPARPGLTNALGCLVADLRQDFVNTLNVPLDGARHGATCARSLTAQRAAKASAINAEERSEIVDDRMCIHGADMQFRGQTHLIRVGMPSRRCPTVRNVQELFEAAYFARFQVRLPEIRAVLVNLVTSVIGRRPAPRSLSLLIDAGQRASARDAARARAGRSASTARWQKAPVFDRGALPLGCAASKGRRSSQQMDATTVIEPGAVGHARRRRQHAASSSAGP